MKKNFDFSFVLRYLLMVLLGYLAVSMFIIAFLAASQAKDRLSLPAPLSEGTALVIASIITLPIVLPFIWKRLNKVKIGDLEINLSEVSAKVKLTLADELRDVQRLTMGPSALPNLIEKLSTAITEAGAHGIVEIEFGIGKPVWWSTRLYLLAALAEDYTEIRGMVFLTSRPDRDRIYFGSVSPAVIRQALATDDPRLSEAYHAASNLPAPAPDADIPARRVAWIAQNYVWELNKRGGEEQIKQIITGELLERYRVVIGKSIEWNGGPLTTLLIHDIIEQPEPYVTLVKADGQLNLTVDRMKLAEQVAKISLRYQLE